MCGIAGLWNTAADAAALGRMLDALAHRGPDGGGHLALPGVRVGMRRLALVDISPTGDQPMVSPDGNVVIVFNGEIYNHRDERARLERRGHRFRGTSDTEVILALYLDDERDWLTRLRGMFAIAIVDRRYARSGVARLTLARGPLGVKPLYVADAPGQGIAFASEIRALHASGCLEKRVSPRGLRDYLTFGCALGTSTFFAGARMVASGHVEVYEHGLPPRIERFAMVPATTPVVRPYRESVELVRETVSESTRLHMLADAPVGAFLSGGIDSTAIVALARRTVPSLRTFTVAFPEQRGSGLDESAIARETARRLDTIHEEIEVNSRDIAEAFPRFCAELDQPSVDGLNTWIVSRAAARTVKAALSGLGGDEWFCGYPVARRVATQLVGARAEATRVGAWMGRALSGVVGPGPLLDRTRGLAMRDSPLGMWMASRTIFRDAPVRDEHHVELDRARVRGILDALEPHWSDAPPLAQCTTMDAVLYMQSQLLRDSDVCSMAHSLELRVPLVDIEVARLARSLRPEELMERDALGRVVTTKRVLLDALRSELPEHVLRRPKRGFSLPFDAWLAGPLRDHALDALSDESVRRRGLLDVARVRELRESWRTGKTLGFPRVWSLVVLEECCRAWLD